MLSNKGRDPVERGPGFLGKLRFRRAQYSEIIPPAGGVHLGTTAIQRAETRNPKQTPSSKVGMTKTTTLLAVLSLGALGI